MVSEWRWRDRFLSACIAWVPGIALFALALGLMSRDGWWWGVGFSSGLLGLSLIGGGFKIYADRTHPDEDDDRGRMPASE